MKTSYISPRLNIVCFLPVERLAVEDLDLNLDLVRVGLYSSRRGEKVSVPETEDEDIPLPFI